MYIEKFVNTVKAEPLVFTVGMCVLLLAVMGTSVRHVSSAMFSVLFLLSFIVIKDWKKVYLSLSGLEKTFLIAFFLFTVSGMLSFYNADDVTRYYRLFERYLRFMLIIPVYLLIVRKNISVLNFLYTGSVMSGPFLFAIALNHYIKFPDVPAQGYYHHIIFGQLAMLNVGIMMSLLLVKTLKRQLQVIIIVSILCGIATAVMSQARGVWLVFPLYVLIATYYSVKDRRIEAKYFVILTVALILLSVFTPIGSLIKERSEAAITEVSRFYTEDEYVSSLGTRLAMWDIAIEVWEKNPVLGTGPGDFDDEIISLQKKGEYVGMDVHNSVHNIYLQALVGSGVVGFIALLLVLIIMPVRLFLDKNRFNKEGCIAGLITVISFSIYGLSESWTLRLATVSVFLVYIVVIAAHVHIHGNHSKVLKQ